MNRWALPLLALLAAPFAAANLQHSGTLETDEAHVPQMHCEFIQTEPRTRAEPDRCDVAGALKNAMVLRIRLLGAGRAYAFLYDEVRQAQIAQLECVATVTSPYAPCVKVLGSNGFPLTAPRVRLHAFLDGPGAAAATVTVEKVQYSLP